MSVESLAHRSRHASEEVEAILRGEVDPGLGTIMMLAGALGAAPEELVKGSLGSQLGMAVGAISSTRMGEPSQRPRSAAACGRRRGALRRYHFAAAAR
jgi:hypothetical protein